MRRRLAETMRPAGPMPQSVYWRRRGVALLAALGLLSLIAWAFSGALGSGAPASGGQASGSASTGQAGHGGPGGSGGAASGGQRALETSGAAGAARRVRACPHGAVVLSLFASQSAYPGTELPEFTVDVVGTARPTCTFDVGARHVALVIESGSHRLWSSADCAAGTGSLLSDLQRGVPTVIPISWNRQASAPGCATPSAPAAPGTYSATAVDGAVSSNTITFRLG